MASDETREEGGGGERVEAARASPRGAAAELPLRRGGGCGFGVAGWVPGGVIP